MKNIDISALDTMPIDELASLPPAVLVDLQDAAGNAMTLARRRVAMLGDALDRKYGKRAQAERQSMGKDTGIVRLNDDGYEVVAETKKSVVWDQAKLAKLYGQIQTQGEDPEVYIVSQTVLKVREASYATWPKGVKSAFEPARVVKAGTPSYRIERAKAEAA